MQHFLRNSILILAFGLCGTLAEAQPSDRLSGIGARPSSGAQPPSLKKTTAVNLPFFDDFSYDQHFPNPQLWEDANVYVNQTFGTAPPTLGVTTFDGLDNNGQAYELGQFGVDTTDILTSQPINLGSPQDSVYLSFFWQAGGNGEQPESTDSLSLLFFTPQSGEWKSVWRARGVDSTAFEQVMIPIPTAYHKNGFQFRFISYGAKAGAFDTWNLDYVRLDDSRSFQDMTFDDVAFTRPHPSLLKSYQSIPWFHYSTGLLNKNVLLLHYRRNKRIATQAMNLCIYEISSGSTVLASDYIGNSSKDDSHASNVETVYDCAIGDFYTNLNIPNNEFEITAYQSYAGANEDESPNDTIFRHQVFKNYYAYDDGSAERAYVVDDNAGGFVLMKYQIGIQEDLLGLYIYFVPSEYDITKNQFKIVIYQDNNGVPGSLLYEGDTTYTPHFTTSDFFLPYPLNKDHLQGFQVSGSVFIGIKQIKNSPLPIGFDVNSRYPQEIFYGKPNDYFQSGQKGMLMMRPYLRYLPNDFAISENKKVLLQPKVFPNPAKSYIQIEDLPLHEIYTYSLINLAGQTVQQGSLTPRIQLNKAIISGVYIIKITDPSGSKSPYITKLVIEK